jgi:hypothetical protein
MIGDLQQAVLQVEELAWNVEREDLTRAVAEDLLTEGKSMNQHGTQVGRLAFAREVGVTLILLPSARQVDDGSLVFAREGEPALPPSEERAE